MKRLLGDKTVGRLVKWLRILGIPCETLEIQNASQIPDGAFLLTRSRKLASPKTILISSDKVEEQLKEIFEKLPELKENIQPFSLCIRCSTLLEEISREEILGLVPDYIYAKHSKFKLCPRCGRIYWPGSHQKRMHQKITEFFTGKSNKNFSFLNNWPKK